VKSRHDYSFGNITISSRAQHAERINGLLLEYLMTLIIAIGVIRFFGTCIDSDKETEGVLWLQLWQNCLMQASLPDVRFWSADEAGWCCLAGKLPVKPQPNKNATLARPPACSLLGEAG
jgi:hypothetical protein